MIFARIRDGTRGVAHTFLSMPASAFKECFQVSTACLRQGGVRGIRMNRSELTDIVYERHGGMSRKEASELVNLILRLIRQRLLDGEKVEITGFGSFRISRKRERRGRNPQTGERIAIPARRSLTFRASRLLKDDLNRE